MNHSEESSLRPRQTVLLPVSIRTLQHPSFLPLYIFPEGFHRQTHHTVCPIIPEELFYSDPTTGCGMRIWNTQTRVFSHCQLNVPQPIMSACVAPPNHPDPFRSGWYPIRDLGSPTWRVQSARPQRAVIQLTQEEDQAITNLLKLHHQGPPESSAPAPQLDLSGPGAGRLTASSPEEAVCVDARCPRLKRGRRHLEAAPLLSGTALQDAGSATTPNKTAALDRPLCLSTRTPPKYETLSAVTTFDKATKQNGAPQRSSNSKRIRLSASEEDAVFVLLKLGRRSDC